MEGIPGFSQTSVVTGHERLCLRRAYGFCTWEILIHGVVWRGEGRVVSAPRGGRGVARGTEPASGAQPRGGSRDAGNRVPHAAAEAAVQTSWCRVSPGARAPGGLWVSALRGSGFFTEHTRSAGAASDPAGAVTRKFDPKGVSSRLQTQQTERATFISIDTRSEPRLGGRRTQRRRAGVRLEGRIGSVRVIDDPCGGRGVVVPVPRPHRETQKGGGKA